MQFRLANPTRLAPPNLYATVEEAASEGRSFWPGEAFKVQQVREAKLSDFFNMDNVLSDMREAMKAKCGDDSLMDIRSPEPGLQVNEGMKLFDSRNLALAMAGVLDDFAEYAELDLSGLLIVEREYAIKPEA